MGRDPWDSKNLLPPTTGKQIPRPQIRPSPKQRRRRTPANASLINPLLPFTAPSVTRCEAELGRLQNIAAVQYLTRHLNLFAMLSSGKWPRGHSTWIIAM